MRLVGLIVKTRKAKKLSQATLAKKLKISQARIAQIESGVGTAKVAFVKRSVTPVVLPHKFATQRVQYVPSISGGALSYVILNRTER